MIKLLKNFKTKEWLMVAFVIVLIVAQVLFDLKLPDFMGQIVKQSTSQAAMSEIWNTGFKMIAITLSSVACAVIINLFSSLIGARFARTLRRLMFEKVNSFSMEEMNGFSTASLITRTTNDVTQIQTTLNMFFRMAIYAPLLAIMAVVKIINKNLILTGVTGAGIVCMFIVVVLMVVFVIPKFTKIQKQVDKLNALTRENLTGLKVIRAYSAEGVEEKKFEKANNDLTNTYNTINVTMSFLSPAMSFIMMGLSLAITWVGAGLVNQNPAFLSDMVIFTQYAMQVLSGFMMLSMMFVFLPRGIVSAKRINAVLNTAPKILDGKENFKKNSKHKGEIEFKNVCFRYPNAEEDVLCDINLKINKGETAAFIGSTGSGKSTLINLIPRFYDVTNGEIIIDGVNIKDVALHNLHNKIGYVPQKGVLFSGTVTENIKYGKFDASMREVKKAIEIAQAKEFVERFEHGYDGYISQGGKNVSGGQKQRLSIARAIVKKPEIYIFDDSFSALDYKTDARLRTELKKNIGDATCLIVAQRIGTIMNADKIFVLDNGKIVGMGKHEELLQNCKVYKEIAYSQLSKEELENA